MKRSRHLLLTGFFLLCLTPFLIAQDLVITAAFDGGLSGGLPKGVELHAIADIPDLSIYGIGSANNGGGTDSIEFSLSGSILAGECLFVASDSTAFNDWFGFFPHFASDAANINGDDAIELFMDGVVIDVFGDINVDGTGEAWEYLDSWAYRVSGTGPDGDTFVLENWTFGGINLHDGVSTNDGSDAPMPVCGYTNEMPTEVVANDDDASADQGVTDLAIDIAGNDVIPTGIASVTIVAEPANGTASFDGTNLLYTPNPDFCGLDTLSYELCDLNGSCGQANVYIDIACPPMFIELGDDTAFGPAGAESVLLDIFSNDVFPDLENLSLFIITDPENGTWGQDPVTFDLFYYPNPGFCGEDFLLYEACDLNGCDTAMVTITIECPIVYETVDIAAVTGLDADGVNTALGANVEITGTVYGVDMQGNDNIQFTIHDGTDGISLFSTINYGYVVNEGDEVTVRGSITQYNGLSQVQPNQNPGDTLYISGAGSLVAPTDVTALGEETESELVRIVNVTFDNPADWDGMGSGFNMACTDDMGNTYAVRIDNDVDLYSMAAPSGVMNITGIGGQFDSSSPFTSGYQLLPRYAADIEEVTDVEEVLAAQFKVYPNPAHDVLYLDMQEQADAVRITNLIGQTVYNAIAPAGFIKLDTGNWTSGVYNLTFVVGHKVVNKQLTIQH